jgi:hypothetical protein
MKKNEIVKARSQLEEGRDGVDFKVMSAMMKVNFTNIIV